MSVRSRMANGAGTAMVEPERPVLARDAVKYVGQPVVAVVADDEAAALDAVEAISVDYDDLPVVLDLEAAVSGGAPPLWEQAPGNVGIDWHKGNPAETARAFAEAAHVVELTVRHPRIAVAPVESRGCVGAFAGDTT